MHPLAKSPPHKADCRYQSELLYRTLFCIVTRAHLADLLHPRLPQAPCWCKALSFSANSFCAAIAFSLARGRISGLCSASSDCHRRHYMPVAGGHGADMQDPETRVSGDAPSTAGAIGSKPRPFACSLPQYKCSRYNFGCAAQTASSSRFGKPELALHPFMPDDRSRWQITTSCDGV